VLGREFVQNVIDEVRAKREIKGFAATAMNRRPEQFAVVVPIEGIVLEAVFEMDGHVANGKI
jgi:hypothetical protein